MFNKFKKKFSIKGAAVIETALTIPVVLYLIFFLIELIKVKDVQSAVDAIAEECSVQFMFTKSTNVDRISTGAAQEVIYSNFESIIEKYRPRYIPASEITYYFTFFDSPKDLYENDKNIAVYWPEAEESSTPAEDMIIESTSDPSFSSEIMEKISNYKHPEKGLREITLNHRAFILTVVVKYRFSSAFVSKLFMGGSNTKNGETFLIWSRGVGFCR